MRLRKVSVPILVFIVFLLIPSMAAAEISRRELMEYHGLLKTKRYKWEALNLQEGNADLTSNVVRIRWINLVAGKLDMNHKRIVPSEYLQYDSVVVMMEKNDKIFRNLVKLTGNLDKVLGDMHALYGKAKALYQTEIPDEETNKIKRRILKKVKKAYLALRKHATNIQGQGRKIEGVLGQLSRYVIKAYSTSKLGNALAREFTDRFSLSKLTVGDQDIEKALQNTENEMRDILRESESIYQGAMQNLDLEVTDE